MGNDTIISAPSNNGDSGPERHIFGELFRLGIISVLYLLSIMLSRALAGADSAVPFWFPSGFFLSFLLIAKTERRARRVPLFFMLNLIAHVALGRGLLQAAGFAAADAVEASLGAWVLLYYLKGEFTFENLREVFGFVIISALLATAVGALIHAGTSTWLGPGGNFIDLFPCIWVARVVGVLLAAPLILVCWWGFSGTRTRGGRKMAEFALLMVFTILMTIMVFRGAYVEHIYPWMYLVFPPLFWACMRFGLKGGVVFSPVVVFAAIWSMASGEGSLLICENYAACLIRFQLYSVVMAVTSLALGVVVSMGRRTGLALQESESHKGAILASAPECIIAVNQRGRIIEFNPAAEAVFGYTRERAMGLALEDLLSSNTESNEFALFSEEGDREFTPVVRIEVMGKHEDESWFPAELTIRRVQGREPPMYTVYMRDITRLKLAQEQLTYEAFHDKLTGLPNRELFVNRLDIQLIYAERNNGSLCVASLDLDDFKKVNDSLGHHVGDLFLMEMASRFKACIRDEDTVSRGGGDGFLFLLTDLKNMPADALLVTRRILDRLEQVVFLDGHELYPRASIGLAIYPGDGDEVGTLLRNCEIAMHRAKEKGNHEICIYSPSMNTRALKRIGLESSLSRALEREEFRVHYQPKVDIGTGRTSGTEALIRWQRSEEELVPPYEFIPLAEESGLIVPMGVWILRTACRQTRLWQEMGFSDLSVAVNLSAKQFQEDDLPETVCAVLSETGLSPECLNLEITENILMADVDAAVKTMDRLSKMGIKLSIDDFGTGYSSLNYLKKLPVDILKIDRSFVKDIPHDTNDMAISKAVIALGQSLNLKVVAEGVETPEQVEFMRKHGADEIQGYVFCRPLPEDELSVYLDEEAALSRIGTGSRDPLTGETVPIYPFSSPKPSCPAPFEGTNSSGPSVEESPSSSAEEKSLREP